MNKIRCTFYSKRCQPGCDATVLFPESGKQIKGFYITNNESGRVWVYFPEILKKAWNVEEISKGELTLQLEEAYSRRFLFGPKTRELEFTVSFGDRRDSVSYLVDVMLPDEQKPLKGFRLKDDGLTIRVAPPKWLETPWDNAKYPWHQLCTEIRQAYTEQYASGGTDDKIPPAISAHNEDGLGLLQPKQTGAEEERKDEVVGRCANAANCAFWFVPHAVLRPSKLSNRVVKRSVYELVTALTRPPKDGGIGLLEIGILTWIERLRYLTNAMVRDLISGGYISLGGVKASDLDKRLNEGMLSYQLIAPVNFVSVDENGDEVEESKSTSEMQIYTLTKMGSNMLKELGRSAKFNAFDICRDGNTVKRLLAANQWLIYWLKTFPSLVGENYESEQILEWWGPQQCSARLHGIVTCNECTMVGEPLRRVEDFEVESDRDWMRDKFLRMVGMFEHLDELYLEGNKVDFPQRPILVYICEDDQHILEVWNVLRDLIDDAGEQTIWFTADFRIFNHDMIGQRFLKIVDGQTEVVDIRHYIGAAELPTDC